MWLGKKLSMDKKNRKKTANKQTFIIIKGDHSNRE